MYYNLNILRFKIQPAFNRISVDFPPVFTFVTLLVLIWGVFMTHHWAMFSFWMPNNLLAIKVNFYLHGKGRVISWWILTFWPIFPSVDDLNQNKQLLPIPYSIIHDVHWLYIKLIRKLHEKWRNTLSKVCTVLPLDYRHNSNLRVMLLKKKWKTKRLLGDSRRCRSTPTVCSFPCDGVVFEPKCHHNLN